MRKADLKNQVVDSTVTPDVPDDINAIDSSNYQSNSNDNQLNGQDTYDHSKESGEKWSEQRGLMTWTSLVSMIILMSAMFFVQDPSKIKALGDIATIYFMTMGSIVCAFFGIKAILNFRK